MLPIRIFPPPLPIGGGIGIFSPSFPGPALFPDRAMRGKLALESLGFHVLFPAIAAQQVGYVSASSERRAQALHDLFADDDVHAIICSIGGSNSNAILPFLDYKFIAAHPKVLVGYSDATALILSVFARTGLVTFHGPALMPQWGEAPRPMTYSAESFLRVTGVGAEETTVMLPARTWTSQRVDWGASEDLQTRTAFHLGGWTTVRPGRATGLVLGGNLGTLNAIVGTVFCPNFANSILLIEAVGDEAELPRLDRALQHLELAGILDGVRGIIAARCPDASPHLGVTFYDLLRRYGANHGIPVCADLDFGHTDPIMTIPLGVFGEIDCTESYVNFRLLERPVAQ